MIEKSVMLSLRKIVDIAIGRSFKAPGTLAEGRMNVYCVLGLGGLGTEGRAGKVKETQ